MMEKWILTCPITARKSAGERKISTFKENEKKYSLAS